MACKQQDILHFASWSKRRQLKMVTSMPQLEVILSKRSSRGLNWTLITQLRAQQSTTQPPWCPYMYVSYTWHVSEWTNKFQFSQQVLDDNSCNYEQRGKVLLRCAHGNPGSALLVLWYGRWKCLTCLGELYMKSDLNGLAEVSLYSKAKMAWKPKWLMSSSCEHATCVV